VRWERPIVTGETDKEEQQGTFAWLLCLQEKPLTFDTVDELVEIVDNF
jgi:hypothetical protein